MCIYYAFKEGEKDNSILSCMNAMEENKEKKAIIVGVNINDENFENSMDELKELAYACDIDVVCKVTQNLNVISSSLYIGSGKAEEIKEECVRCDANLVIFNDELSSSQIRNLGKIIPAEIIDRTTLILEIFARRAKTKEAKIQVEIAKLKYLMPRLVGLHSMLGRQGGGSGFSNRGSGEKKIELDKRKIEDEISKLNVKLKYIENERELRRRNRMKSEVPIVALAGYTNAGKSTLMNAFIEKYVEEENQKMVEEKDMLFATLDTSIRNISLEDNKKFLLSDTVGFVSKLPHNLVKAFRSTLEEIVYSNLILHVVDVSDSNYSNHIAVTNETLIQIGADNIPVIYVYNKADKIMDDLPKVEDNKIYISALNRVGIDELTMMIKKMLFLDYVNVTFLIPYDKGAILTNLKETSTIKSIDYNEKGTIINVECKKADYDKYHEYELK